MFKDFRTFPHLLKVFAALLKAEVPRLGRFLPSLILIDFEARKLGCFSYLPKFSVALLENVSSEACEACQA